MKLTYNGVQIDMQSIPSYLRSNVYDDDGDKLLWVKRHLRVSGTVNRTSVVGLESEGKSMINAVMSLLLSPRQSLSLDFAGDPLSQKGVDCNNGPMPIRCDIRRDSVGDLVCEFEIATFSKE